MKTTIIKETGELFKNKEMTVVEFANAKELAVLCQESTGQAKKHFNTRDSFNLGSFKPSCIKDIADGRSVFKFDGTRRRTKKNVMGHGMKRRKKFSEYDGIVDATRVMGASIQPFVKRGRRNSKMRTLSIFISPNASSREGADDIGKFALEAVSTIYEYVKAGYMVEVYSLFVAINGTTSNEHVTNLIKLKGFNEPIDFKRLSCVAYPAFFRVYQFAALCMHDKRMSMGLGSPANTEQSEHVINNLLGKRKSHLFSYSDWKQNGGKIIDKIK